MKSFTLFIGLYIYSLAAFANAYLPGSISTVELGKPATDLIYNGRTLTVPEAIDLREQGVDLSKVDPKESDLWRRNGFSTKTINIPEERIEYTYQGLLLSRLGNFRFNAKADQGYTFLLGKRSFTALLRAKALEKLGYQVPAMKRVSSVKIKFKTETEKNSFVDDLTQASFADPRSERWIVEEEETSLVLQDVIAMNQNQKIYNLALGAMSTDVIQGRRVFNALLAVFNILDISESINLLPFESHRVFGENVILPYELAQEFSANIEDIQGLDVEFPI